MIKDLIVARSIVCDYTVFNIQILSLSNQNWQKISIYFIFSGSMCVLPVVCNNKVLNEVGDVSQSLSQEFKWNWHYGAFNNYVDQILPNFDPLPPRVDNDT